ncbi:MAG: ABC transporter permease, partial [Pseudomonadota bacterium]
MAAILSLIGRRLALGLLTLLVVSIIIFAAIEALPGNFAAEILGQGATQDAIDAIRRDLGLDQPYLTRYFTWLVGMLQGDLGISFAQMNFA